MKKIYLLWATARPATFQKVHKIWMDRAGDEKNIYTLVAVDSTEHYMELQNEFCVNIVSNPRKGITRPLHELTKMLWANDTDIIVVPSDDFYPPQDWDLHLKSLKFEALQVNDGHQEAIISMPVMTYECLLKLNRTIYNPVYNHMYSDQELYDVLTELDLLTVDKSDKIFEHKNPAFGGVQKDAVNNAVNLAFFQMKSLYKRRKNLPAEEKLKGFKLSILICSIFERAEKLEELLQVLEPQLNGQTEIIISLDNKEKPVGQKRNELLELAEGEYIVFIDDDDMVPDYYISKIFEALAHKPDAVGITVKMTTNGKNPEMGYCSMKNENWLTHDHNGIKSYLRPIHHLCPVKRKLAIEAGFPRTNFSEDEKYSKSLQPLLNSEKFIEATMYYYLFRVKQPKLNNLEPKVRRVV